jgi:hypothetical protein
VADDGDAARRPVPQQRASAPRGRCGARPRAPLPHRPVSRRDGGHGRDRAGLRRPRAAAPALRRSAVVSGGHLVACGGPSGRRPARRRPRRDRRAEGLRRAAHPFPAPSPRPAAVSLPAPGGGRRPQHARGSRRAPERPRGAHRICLDGALVARSRRLVLARSALLRLRPLTGGGTARRDRDEPLAAASLCTRRRRRLRGGGHCRPRRLRGPADAGPLVRPDRARPQRASLRASGARRPERRAGHPQARGTPAARRAPPRERPPPRGRCRRGGR